MTPFEIGTTKNNVNQNLVFVKFNFLFSKFPSDFTKKPKQVD